MGLCLQRCRRRAGHVTARATETRPTGWLHVPAGRAPARAAPDWTLQAVPRAPAVQDSTGPEKSEILRDTLAEKDDVAYLRRLPIRGHFSWFIYATMFETYGSHVSVRHSVYSERVSGHSIYSGYVLKSQLSLTARYYTNEPSLCRTRR